MIIYKTTNLVNKKIYIGQDSKNNPEYLGSGAIVKKAIKKYGKENFKKEILEEINDTHEIINEREKYWIKYYNSTDNKIGYNISLGGQTGFMLGLSHSDETKKKFSEYRKGKFTGDKNSMYGKHHSDESKKKMARPQFGDKNGMYGKHHTEETKNKVREKVSGEKNHFFGKKHSDETIKKISEAAKKRKTNPNSKKIFANGLVFNNGSEASKYFNISHGTVSYRCKSDNFNWYWL